MAIKFLNTVQVDTDVLYVDAANDRVGIGTTSPRAKLDVTNGSSGQTYTNVSGLLIDVNGTSNSYSGLRVGSSTGNDHLVVTNAGNVGIGTTSPSAKLHVSGGDIRIDDTEQLQFGAGGVRINNDAAGRMYFNAPLAYYWQAGSGYRMVLLNSGNVGIGTTSPGERLEITGSTPTAGDTTLNLKVPAGNIAIGATEMGNILFSSSDASTGGTGSVAKISTIAGDGSGAWTGNGRPTDLAFFTQPLGASATLVESMRIDQDGNVGIGTTDPDALLHVRAATNVTGTIEVQGGKSVVTSIGEINSELNFGSNDASATGGIGGSIKSVTESTNGAYVGMSFYTAKQGRTPVLEEAMRIDQDGNVGFGTTSPSAKLDVAGNIICTESLIIKDTGGTKSLSLLRELNYATINNGVETLNYNALSHIFLTGLAEKMRIASNGNVGIGTTNPDSKLHIADSTSPIFTFQRLDTVVTANEVIGQFDFKSNDSSDTGVNASIKAIKQDLPVATVPMAITFETGVSGTVGERMRIDSTGNVGIGNTNPSDYSADANNLVVGSLSGNNGITILSTASNGYGSLYFADATTGNKVYSGFIRYQQSQSVMNFGTNEVERMRIDVNGNVGIGTTSPGGNLHVVGASGNSGRIYLSDRDNGIGGGQALLLTKTGVNSYIYNRDSGDLRLGTDDQFSYVTIKPTGNVGIGTTSPQEKVHVVEAVTGDTLLEVENTATNSLAGIKLTSGSNNYVAYTSSAGNFEIFNTQTGKVNFVIAANGQGAFGNAIDTSTGAAFSVGGGGGVRASKYINQRVVWATGFSHATNNSSAYYYFPVAGYLLTTTNQYYNGWIAPYAGRVKRITIRNVSGTSSAPTATTVNFRVSVNGSVIYTGANVTIVGSTYNKYAMEDIIPSNADFVASDRIQVAFRTNGLWRNAAASISLEYTE